MMNDQNKKQRMTSWIMLGAILVVVGGLLTVWAFRFDDNLAYDREHAEPVNISFDNLQSTIQSLGKLWDEKVRGQQTSQTADEQNQGQTGQLTNAGLTNEQIDTIQTDLFANTAPQQ